MRLSQEFNDKRIVFSTNEVGTTGKSNGKKKNGSWTPISHHIINNSKWIKSPNIRAKTLMLIEENGFFKWQQKHKYTVLD